MKQIRLLVLLLPVLLVACAGSTKKADPVQPAPAPAPAAQPAAPAPAAPVVTAPAPQAIPNNPAAREAAAMVAATTPEQKREIEWRFAQETAMLHGLDAKEIMQGLSQATYQQSIINAITRPAEAKPWYAYRPIFMTEARIANGAKFKNEHRALLNRISNETGVPAEIIVSIIGVETSYGGNTGSFRVLDALYTLGLHYPRRAEYFRGELAHFFKLTKQENIDLLQARGSYAGAMGLGQFMPSSYRNYAKDGDGDGRRDLWNSKADIFASVANYFIGHGWRKGQPTFIPAMATDSAQEFKPENWEAKYTLADLRGKGYAPAASAPDLPVTLLTLDANETSKEYWVGYHNFWVITRYNRSPLYAMSVWQLSQAIAQRDQAVNTPAMQ
jgi:membrane-bound lytic murein transglycosylase B